MSPDAEAVQLVTFSVPGSSAEPMEVKVAHSGLRMVLVNRESTGLLNESWRVLGVYFLLGAADDPDRYRAYVGEVGKSTLVGRLKQHAARKDWWSRALLIASLGRAFPRARLQPFHDLRHASLTHAAAAGNPQIYVQARRPLAGLDHRALHARRAGAVSRGSREERGADVRRAPRR